MNKLTGKQIAKQINKLTSRKTVYPESPVLQLSWIISSSDKLSILSVGRYTYTSDLRFQPVMRDDPADDSETWTLRIRRVKLEDEAKYECQINTKPEKSRHIYLRVVGESRQQSSVPLFHFQQPSYFLKT